MSATETPTAAPDTSPAAIAEKIPPRISHVWSSLNHARLKVENYIWNREPRLVPTTIMFVGVGILLGLGTWQMMRLQEKNALIENVQQQLHVPAKDLRSEIPPNDYSWSQLHFHPVIVQGTWLPTMQFKLAPRTHEGAVGYHLIRALRLANNQVVMIDQGFMPEKMALLPPDSKTVTISGIARLQDAEKPKYLPENDPARGNWFWLDLKAMHHEVGVNSLVPVVIYENRVTDRDSYPIGGQLPLPLTNDHWHYAVTWYALALALMGVWMIASTPKNAAEQKPVDGTENKDLDPVARRGMYPEATD